MKKIRSFYWRNPSLTSELPKEERKKITDKFMELAAKDKEKNAEWFSKVMEGKNKTCLTHVAAIPKPVYFINLLVCSLQHSDSISNAFSEPFALV